ncbi:RAD51-associated protein 1-like isoform X2 [Cololabis saira]|uniref:RAD51-associated protein 1-like isoform X2 n=1 Tax=Cololabis saira TaxID=129043 RepID=UPI002AD2F719|nr:RAD51-associated protein 1-like isoform X2 [Cololabis saira]
MERPCRKTKSVNYCESKDLDDDDDFACVKGPPNKKVREDVKPEQKKPSSKEANSQYKANDKSRKPLDDRLSERDLEAAIALSLLNNGDGLKEQPSASKDVKIQIPIDENTDPTSLRLSNCSVDGTIMGLDKISSQNGSPASANQRKAASKASVVQIKDDDDDDDYQPKLTPGSESDEDYSDAEESEDEEFTVKKVSKAKKKDNTTKKDKNKPSPTSNKKEKQPTNPPKFKSQPAAASTPVPSAAPPKVAVKRPASSPTCSTPKPAASLSPAGGRVPAWNPPGQIGKSPTSSQSGVVKSPGQGLRLGLSRRVPVKPLHPSVTSR